MSTPTPDFVVRNASVPSRDGTVDVALADADDPAALADRFARAGVGVATCHLSTPPGMPIAAFREAGVPVAMGTDQVRDMWSPHGNADPLQGALVESLRLSGPYYPERRAGRPLGAAHDRGGDAPRRAGRRDRPGRAGGPGRLRRALAPVGDHHPAAGRPRDQGRRSRRRGRGGAGDGTVSDGGRPDDLPPSTTAGSVAAGLPVQPKTLDGWRSTGRYGT